MPPKRAPKPATPGPKRHTRATSAAPDASPLAEGLPTTTPARRHTRLQSAQPDASPLAEGLETASKQPRRRAEPKPRAEPKTRSEPKTRGRKPAQRGRKRKTPAPVPEEPIEEVDELAQDTETAPSTADDLEVQRPTSSGSADVAIETTEHDIAVSEEVIMIDDDRVETEDDARASSAITGEAAGSFDQEYQMSYGVGQSMTTQETNLTQGSSFEQNQQLLPGQYTQETEFTQDSQSTEEMDGVDEEAAVEDIDRFQTSPPKNAKYYQRSALSDFAKDQGYDPNEIIEAHETTINKNESMVTRSEALHEAFKDLRRHGGPKTKRQHDTRRKFEAARAQKASSEAVANATNPPPHQNGQPHASASPTPTSASNMTTPRTSANSDAPRSATKVNSEHKAPTSASSSAASGISSAQKAPAKDAQEVTAAPATPAEATPKRQSAMIVPNTNGWGVQNLLTTGKKVVAGVGRYLPGYSPAKRQRIAVSETGSPSKPSPGPVSAVDNVDARVQFEEEFNKADGTPGNEQSTTPPLSKRKREAPGSAPPAVHAVSTPSRATPSKARRKLTPGPSRLRGVRKKIAAHRSANSMDETAVDNLEEFLGFEQDHYNVWQQEAGHDRKLWPNGPPDLRDPEEQLPKFPKLPWSKDYVELRSDLPLGLLDYDTYMTELKYERRHFRERMVQLVGMPRQQRLPFLVKVLQNEAVDYPASIFKWFCPIEDNWKLWVPGFTGFQQFTRANLAKLREQYDSQEYMPSDKPVSPGKSFGFDYTSSDEDEDETLGDISMKDVSPSKSPLKSLNGGLPNGSAESPSKAAANDADALSNTDSGRWTQAPPAAPVPAHATLPKPSGPASTQPAPASSTANGSNNIFGAPAAQKPNAAATKNTTSQSSSAPSPAPVSAQVPKTPSSKPLDAQRAQFTKHKPAVPSKLSQELGRSPSDSPSDEASIVRKNGGVPSMSTLNKPLAAPTGTSAGATGTTTTSSKETVGAQQNTATAEVPPVTGTAAGLGTLFGAGAGASKSKGAPPITMAPAPPLSPPSSPLDSDEGLFSFPSGKPVKNAGGKFEVDDDIDDDVEVGVSPPREIVDPFF